MDRMVNCIESRSILLSLRSYTIVIQFAFPIFGYVQIFQRFWFPSMLLVLCYGLCDLIYMVSRSMWLVLCQGLCEFHCVMVYVTCIVPRSVWISLCHGLSYLYCVTVYVIGIAASSMWISLCNGLCYLYCVMVYLNLFYHFLCDL